MRFGLPWVCAVISLAAACSSYPSVKRKTELVNTPDAGTASGGTSGGIIDTDGSLDSGENPDGSCGATTLTATRRPVQVLLVVDSSTSMNQIPAGFSTTKWAAMRAALQTVLDTTKGSLSYGLELFPQGATATSLCQMQAAASAIGVPVAPGTSSASQILAVLEQTTLALGTPTAAALAEALEYFTTGAGKALPGDKVVLLATDGGPNCDATLTCGIERCTTNLDGTTCPGAPGGNCCVGGLSCLDDTGAIAGAAALLGAGIKTFVVGIPGSEVYATTLDQLARAGRTIDAGTSTDGGAPLSYFPVDANGGTSGLTSVLLGITQKLINSCRLELAKNPPNPDLLNVEIDGTRIPKGPNGWELDQTAPAWAVVLGGTTCTKVETEGAQQVNIVYGCPTVQ